VNLTYRQLLSIIQKMDSEQLDQSVSVYMPDMDEFVGVKNVLEANSTDVLDYGHSYLYLDMKGWNV
jgi:hypothetical protein